MIYYILKYFEELVKDALFAFGVLNLQMSGKKKFVVSSVGAVVVVLLSSFTYGNISRVYDVVLNTAIGYVWFCCCCEDKLWKKSLLYIFCRLAIDVTDTIFQGGVLLFTGYSISVLVDNIGYTILADGISIILLLVVIIFRKKFGKESKAEIPLQYYLIVGGAFLICSLLLASCQGILRGYTQQYQNVMFFMCGIGCILIIIMSVLLVFVIHSRQYFKNLNQLNKQYQVLQKNYYVELYEKTQELRTFRHDYKYHIHCMRELCKRDNIEGLYKYIDGLTEIKNELSTIFTGNYIADAIMNHFVEEMRRKDIVLEWIGYLPEQMDIDMIEFCSLLSNGIENAIEACEKLKQNRYITVEVQQDNQYVYMDIINSMENIDLEMSKLLTTKEDKLNHGFGTKSMKKIVEAYGGTIVWKLDNGIMKVEIELPIQIKKV